jgi:hypothetical protein
MQLRADLRRGADAAVHVSGAGGGIRDASVGLQWVLLPERVRPTMPVIVTRGHSE